ncbi:uncharacterized protein LOC128256648 [Drosophila gunungcola]|uniref:Uncharacterized protein n=1 Tax=Drosophila gunungcola TaxID=103775 RepID=A0A9P9YF67_9MUSC|nr:uncharacterized protein LOC128256648 [Drosophila gunungcola]KAI8035830.1 hypothetical protein M5D96_011261 [Drosophila gunungcola]
MDAAYVKFMMCQCLVNRADWGLAVGCINVVYSFFLFQFWVVELVKSLANYPVKWVLLYGFNVMFNVITMMRIVKRESMSVFYWMCETAALLIFRIHHLYYKEDDFWLAKSHLYRASNIVIDVYIGLSMLAMIYVMFGLRLDPDRQFPDEEEMLDHCKFDPQAAAAKAATQKEKVFESQKENENEPLAKEKEVENVYDIEELDQHAIQKLADLVEKRAFSSQEVTMPCEPTAPEEEVHEIPEPSAPPESTLSFDEDFFYEINDFEVGGDQGNDMSLDE